MDLDISDAYSNRWISIIKTVFQKFTLERENHDRTETTTFCSKHSAINDHTFLIQILFYFIPGSYVAMND